MAHIGSTYETWVRCAKTQERHVKVEKTITVLVWNLVSEDNVQGKQWGIETIAPDPVIKP